MRASVPPLALLLLVLRVSYAQQESDQRWVTPGSYRVIVVDAEGVEPLDVPLEAGEQIEDIDFAPIAVGPTIPTWPFTTALGALGIGALACLMPLSRRRGRLGGILVSPGRAFQQVAEQPEWVGPFFLILVSVLILSVAMIGTMLAQMGGDLGGGMPGPMKIVMMIGIPLFMLVSLLVGSFIAWFIRVGVIWILARISGERTRLYPLLSVVGYAYLPEMVLGSLVMAGALSFGLVQISMSGTSSVLMPTSMAGIFPALAAASDPLRHLLEEVELFGLWSLMLTIVGVQRLYGFRMLKSAVIVILYWILTVGAVVGFVALVDVF